MEIDVITKLITDTGVPIAIMIVLFLFIFKIISSYKTNVDKQLEEYKTRCEKQTDDVEKLVEKYHNDYSKITEALNNNTNALNLLSELVKNVVRQDRNSVKNEDDRR